MKIKGRTFLHYSAFLVLFLIILGCSKFETPTKQEYRKDDLTFTHFSNWKVTEDSTTTEEVGEVRFISIEGPSDSILMATRFPVEVVTTIEEYADQIQQGMRQSTKDLTGGIEIVKMGEAENRSSEIQIAGAMRRGLRRDFDIKALGIPVPHRAEYYAVENDKEKWFIVMQSSKEDWDNLKSGFQIILDSISIKPAAAKESETEISPTPVGKKK